MPAPTIGYVICAMSLVALIFVMPVFYTIVVQNIEGDMMTRELREIADYVSNTIANLYYLIDSHGPDSTSLEKTLVYLPYTVEDSIYILEIVASGANASKVSAYLKNKPSIAGDSWLVQGLKVSADNHIESCERTVLAGCTRNDTGVYAWLRYR